LILFCISPFLAFPILPPGQKSSSVIKVVLAALCTVLGFNAETFTPVPRQKNLKKIQINCSFVSNLNITSIM
jgi:hypothetical protein